MKKVTRGQLAPDIFIASQITFLRNRFLSVRDVTTWLALQLALASVFVVERLWLANIDLIVFQHH